MLEDELYESYNSNGNKTTIDMRKDGRKQFLSPTENVLAALAGCGAVDIVSMLKKRRKTVDALTIDITGTRRDEAPRYFTQIHCDYIVTSPDVEEEELKKTATLAIEKYCSVASSLKAQITIGVQVKRPHGAIASH